MQLDTQPFPINIIELANKKVLVQPKVDHKGKGQNIIIGDPLTSNISQGGIAWKALDRKTNKSGCARGRLNRVAEQSFLTRASRMVMCSNRRSD
jgi:hypothetical protein